MDMGKDFEPKKERDEATVKPSEEVKSTGTAGYKPSTDWDIEEQPATTTNKRRFRLSCLPTTFQWTVSDKFDRVLPPHKRILGLKRKTFCLILAAIFLCLLALIIGLAVGLSQNKKGPKVFNTSADGNLSGDLTYYDPGLGACGSTHTENDAIVAISHIRFDAAGGANPNNNPLCNKKIRIIRNGHAVDVTVVDRCVGCKQDDLDVSLSVFKSLADVDAGRVSTTWSWL